MSETTKPTNAVQPVQPAAAEGGLLPTAPKSPAAAAFLGAVQGPRENPQKMPLIKIHHREGKFELPSGELADEVAGYPLYYFQTRRFYKKAPKPGDKGQPPDCWSADLVEPHDSSVDKQSDYCATCPNNQFGTARDGRAKACATQTWIFLMNTNFGDVPIGVLIAPSSSLRSLLGTRFQAGYFGQAQARHGAYEIVWTRFRLKVMGEGESVTYCVLEPIMGPAQENPDKCRTLAQMRNKFKGLMDEFKMSTPEVEPSEE